MIYGKDDLFRTYGYPKPGRSHFHWIEVPTEAGGVYERLENIYGTIADSNRRPESSRSDLNLQTLSCVYEIRENSPLTTYFVRAERQAISLQANFSMVDRCLRAFPCAQEACKSDWASYARVRRVSAGRAQRCFLLSRSSRKTDV